MGFYKKRPEELTGVSAGEEDDGDRERKRGKRLVAANG